MKLNFKRKIWENIWSLRSKKLFYWVVFILGSAFVPRTWGITPIVIFYDQEVTKAQRVVDLLEKELLIPSSLIVLEKRPDPCQVTSQVIVQICLPNGGEMLVPYLRRDIIKNSFRIFLKKGD